MSDSPVLTIPDEEEESSRRHEISLNMRRILTGSIPCTARNLERRSLSVPCKGYFVAIFLIADEDGAMRREGPDGRALDRVHTLLRNILRQYGNPKNIFIACSPFSQHVTAILSMPPMVQPEAVAIGVVQKTVKLLSDQQGLSIFTALSCYVPHAEGLTRAYQKTLEQAELAKIMGSGHMLVSGYQEQDAEDLLKKTFLYKMQHLTNTLLAENYGEIPGLVKVIADAHLFTLGDNLPRLQSRIAILAGTLSEALRVNHDIPDGKELSHRYLRVQSLQELLALTERTFERLSREASAENSSDVFTRALAYISAHYSDYSLSVDTLCDAIGISKQHLARLFKSRLDTTAGKYINKIRIERSKELLVQTNEPISVIAEKSGFTNDHTFSRNFQSFEGVLPSQFREIYPAAQSRG